jgi:hypothetical protein
MEILSIIGRIILKWISKEVGCEVVDWIHVGEGKG